MTMLNVNWSDVWMETGIGIGIVFTILILLVFVLLIFGKIFAGQKSEAKPAAPKAATPKAAAPIASASEKDKAAVATALYLYFQNVHDVESNVLTIKNHRNSAWHHELNTRY